MFNGCVKNTLMHFLRMCKKHINACLHGCVKNTLMHVLRMCKNCENALRARSPGRCTLARFTAGVKIHFMYIYMFEKCSKNVLGHQNAKNMLKKCFAQNIQNA